MRTRLQARGVTTASADSAGPGYLDGGSGAAGGGGVDDGGLRRRRALQEVELADNSGGGEVSFHDVPVSAGKDEVYGWLRTMRMEKLRPGLASKASQRWTT